MQTISGCHGAFGRLILTGVCAGLAAGGRVAAASAAGAEGLKIGYVNVWKVFNGYQRTKDSEGILEQKGKQKQAELENRVNELTKLRQGLELLNDQARQTKTREIEEKSDALQQLETKSQREFIRERNEAAKQILDEIDQAVKDYATANGFALLLDERSLLYGQDAYDATTEVLRMLNDRYAPKGGKPKP